jgi:hypothetical protein
MLRTLFRLVLLVVVVVAIGAFFFGYRWGGASDRDDIDRPAATTGTLPTIDRDRARQTGAELGEHIAVGAERAERAVSEVSLTAKIKSKMALDDTLKARAIDVDTEGSAVTLRGTVDTEAQRRRAIQLARETAGVTSVADRLEVRQR